MHAQVSNGSVCVSVCACVYYGRKLSTSEEVPEDRKQDEKQNILYTVCGKVHTNFTFKHYDEFIHLSI